MNTALNPATDVRTALDSPVEVTELQPGEAQEWDRFVTESRHGTFFHLYGWRAVVTRVLGHRCYYLAARTERGIAGVYPLCHVRSRLFGDCLVSLPLAVYGGICAESEAAYAALLAAGADLGTRLGVSYVELRNRVEPYPVSLPGRDLYVTFVQNLSSGPEQLFQSLPRDTRYMIRKAQKGGLAWTENLGIDEFYELYARNVHRLGTPAFPKELFFSLQQEFSGRCRIFGVRKGQRAIAGVLCLYFGKWVLPYYSGSLQEFYRDSPNNLLYWKLIEQSCNEGFRWFDFGRSKRGTGSFLFKAAWGMEIHPLPYRYQLIRAERVPQLSPVDRKFRLPVAVWKRLPFPLTKVLGPRFIRHVPSV